MKNHYIEEGAQVKAITCDPAMKAVKKTYKASKKPKVSSVDNAVEYILTGTKKRVTYTVKSGDSPWTIASKYDVTVREILNMNEEKDFSALYPGDKLKLYKINPMVTVTAKQQITTEETIAYETVTKESSEVLKNTTIVEQKGSNGKKKITKLVTTETVKLSRLRYRSPRSLNRRQSGSSSKELGFFQHRQMGNLSRRWTGRCAVCSQVRGKSICLWRRQFDRWSGLLGICFISL